MSVEDIGSIPVSECDDANIPVVCFLSPPGDDDDHPGKWVWSAQNFMPRKEIVGHGYKLVADTEDEILDLISKHVVPLYEAALSKIKTGRLYYWKAEKPNAQDQRAGADRG
jgi:hypothetical protein